MYLGIRLWLHNPYIGLWYICQWIQNHIEWDIHKDRMETSAYTRIDRDPGKIPVPAKIGLFLESRSRSKSWNLPGIRPGFFIEFWNFNLNLFELWNLLFRFLKVRCSKIIELNRIKMRRKFPHCKKSMSDYI